MHIWHSSSAWPRPKCLCLPSVPAAFQTWTFSDPNRLDKWLFRWRRRSSACTWLTFLWGWLHPREFLWWTGPRFRESFWESAVKRSIIINSKRLNLSFFLPCYDVCKSNSQIHELIVVFWIHGSWKKSCEVKGLPEVIAGAVIVLSRVGRAQRGVDPDEHNLQALSRRKKGFKNNNKAR